MQNFLRRKKGLNCTIQMHNFSCTKFLKFLYNSFLKGDFDDCVIWFLLTFFHIFLTNILRLSSSCGRIFSNLKIFFSSDRTFQQCWQKNLGKSWQQCCKYRQSLDKCPATRAWFSSNPPSTPPSKKTTLN